MKILGTVFVIFILVCREYEVGRIWFDWSDRDGAGEAGPGR